MTEKDFFKLNNFKFEGFDYLKVSLEIYNKDEFIKKIKKYV